MNLKYGTRGSKLALHQTRYAVDFARRQSETCQFEEVVIKTLGDKVTGLPLFKVGGQGLFIKEIENALLESKIDIAVHSLKDMPHAMSDGLTIAAIGGAQDPRDCFLSKKYESFAQLPSDAIIGTSSLRRRSQLSSLRDDLKFSDFRGNLDTRLQKLEEGEVDAIILAAAGLLRFDWQQRINHFFSIEEMTPPAGQGLLAIQCREKDVQMIADLFSQFADEESRCRAEAERAFLKVLQGGCQTPMGVFAEVSEDSLKLHSFVGSPDGKSIIKRLHSGKKSEAACIGIRAAEELLDAGAARFMKSQSADVEGNNV